MTTRERYTPAKSEVIVPSPTGKDWRWRSDGEDLVLEKWDGVDTWQEAERISGT